MWTKDVPFKGSPVYGTMAVTGSGIAFSFRDTLLIYDGDGGLVASVTKPQSMQGAEISSPVTGMDGSIYFADRSSVYRLDGMGQLVWQKPLGADQTAGRGLAPRGPVLDPAGRLYVSALDGRLWTFQSEDGQVLSSIDLGVWEHNARYPYVGLGETLAIDRSGIAAAGPTVAAMGLLSPLTGSWLGEVAIGNGGYPVSAYAGYDIGLVATAYLDSTEKTETDVIDRCGNLRWRVPGSYSVPLGITFDDDLIVMDRTPLGAGMYDFALRRFSRDGVLVAGPVLVPDTFCGRSFVGADDTFYYVGYTPSGPAEGYRLRAFDSSLHELWAIPFPHCPDAAVLAPSGKILAVRGDNGKLIAVQTTSPGPAPVSWAQAAGRDARTTLWLAP